MRSAVPGSELNTTLSNAGCIARNRMRLAPSSRILRS